MSFLEDILFISTHHVSNSSVLNNMTKIRNRQSQKYVEKFQAAVLIDAIIINFKCLH
jgi:hypothetical protein